jgi:hypothetical protein
MKQPKTTKKPRGGARPGAGRKPRPAFIDPSKAQPIRANSPLEFLLAVMMDENAAPWRRDAAAKAAAPYMHARYASVEIGKKERAQAEAENIGTDTEWGDDLAVPSKTN